MATQTYAVLTNAQRNAYNEVLLERAVPYVPMFADGQKATIVEHQGTTMEWRIYGGSAVGTTGVGLALATTALTEGTPPTETAITVQKVTKAVQQFGAFVKLSDLLVHQGIDPIWAESYELLGEQSGQTLHTLLINDLAAGTNVQYASTATTRLTVAAGMTMNSAEIREAVRTLRNSKVPTFPDGLYHGLISVFGEASMMNDTDWKSINTNWGGASRSGNNSVIQSSLGDYLGVRWMTSTDAPLFAGAGAAGIDVYGVFIYGPRWYGTVDLAPYRLPSVNANTSRGGLRVTGVPVDTETKDDPLGQFGVAGWKTSYGGKVLQEFRGVRIEHAGV